MAKIIGTSGSDVLKGTKKGDTILGLAGLDQLRGLGGNDVLKGGADVDFLYGGGGRDKLLGGADNDYFEPGGGTDIINGGGGPEDVVSYIGSKKGVTVKLGKNGAATIAKGGDAKDDEIRKVEVVHGSQHNDKIKGNNLNNLLFGNGGNDLMKAGGGDDLMDGGTGNDALYGGSGADTLAGDRGNDDLYGGAGPDRFNFGPPFDHDIIWDFEPGVDKLGLFFTGLDADDILGTPLTPGLAAQVGDDVVITIGINSITLKHTMVSSLSVDDFEFTG